MISLVIPVFNEEILIGELYGRVSTSMESTGQNFEVILVDDGSTDDTLKKLEICNQKDKRFKVLVLSKNFGHQAAYTAGLSYAKGDYVAMMDGDLQDPPELIPKMYEKLNEQRVDIVYGRRTERNEKLLKKISIKIFHFIFKRFSKLKNVEQVGNFSVMSRKALNAFLSLNEKNRYLPGLRSFIGFKQDFVEYARPDRMQGEPKMNFAKLFNLAMDAIFSFSNLPVKICLYSGIVGVILTILSAIYIAIGKITGAAPVGWSSLILSIYFIGSVQLISIGILGEYIFRVYKETQNRPIFLIRDFIE